MNLADAASARFRADPLADDVVASIVGAWSDVALEATATEIVAAQAVQWQRIAAINRVISTWVDNAALTRWDSLPPDIDENVVNQLKAYVEAASALPAWADHEKIKRGQELFMSYGPLSVTLLFCASLPECYVVPDLASVLHATGQLDQHADYRVRATGAMIFPVMMPGGLTTPAGGGIAQVLKVRLIHATIRNLILRQSPQQAMRAKQTSVAPHAALGAQSSNMYHTLFALGWDIKQKGLPCNQDELAYTLLTFSYVYLRSMRKLGLAFSAADEEAVLHTWNVMGHVLGIERALMDDTIVAAETHFTEIQSRARKNPVRPDPRPRLGQALMTVMENEIPLSLLKGVPVLLTRKLCGPTNAAEIGVNERVSLLTRAVFNAGFGLIRVTDTVVRWVLPQFSIARLLTRLLGQKLMYQLLMDQSRPLKLPAHLRTRMEAAAHAWGAAPPSA